MDPIAKQMIVREMLATPSIHMPRAQARAKTSAAIIIRLRVLTNMSRLCRTAGRYIKRVVHERLSKVEGFQAGF